MTNNAMRFLELIAYSGYKYVTLTIIVASQLTLGYEASCIVQAILSSTFVYFFYRSIEAKKTGNTLNEYMQNNKVK